VVEHWDDLRVGRGDLSDAQWAALALVLPQPSRLSRPPMWGKRQLIDGIRWRVRTGARWRDVPSQYGTWQTVYGFIPPLAARRDLGADHHQAAGCGGR
jgi:transposase